MKINLRYPIQGDSGTELSAVSVRRPTGDDMIRIGDDVYLLMQRSEMGEPTAMMSGAVFKAMVNVAGTLSGLGDLAGRLEFTDLAQVVTRALESVGEAEGSSGGMNNGDR